LQKSINSLADSGTPVETIPVGQVGNDCENLWKKMIGKPYSGKPNVRFDEGVLEIGYGWASEALPDERGRNR
jgi:hypothetical protein